MRIDKFLKVSRLIKRREVAKQLCDDGDVFLNGKVAKPSSEIASGDEVKLILGRHTIVVRINDVRPFVKKNEAEALYEVISDEIAERSSPNGTEA
ncbi:MAG: RNA-binding S4 domain-containing protein [Bacilli bacterium]|nr:RNA-binding S4 domain-containing protein [Bacilli bacterium]